MIEFVSGENCTAAPDQPPITITVGDGSWEVTETRLAAALDAFARHEHLGRTAAMQAALEAAAS